MVYLDVYNSIFEYLEEIGIVDDVFEHTEEIISPLLDKIESNEMMNDLAAELALFNYIHNGKLLINFLHENLYPNLNEDEKNEFDLIRESGRFNLKFDKKEKINEFDTKGKELYYFYFHELDNNKSKVIVSSTALDALKFNLNARLVKNPNHKGKFSIIGGIFEREVAELIPELFTINLLKDKLDERKSHIDSIFDFSKKHSLDEIKNYKNKRSAFLKQDKEIMKMNRIFFEKFNMGVDDFLTNFLELTNNTEKFAEMAEYYLSIAEDLNETILDTNYILQLDLLSEKSLIKGFAAFIAKDKGNVMQSLAELTERSKNEFENDIKNEVSLSRENIINHSKKFLKENVFPLKAEGSDLFLKKVDSYTPDQIEKFLSDMVHYLENLSEDTGGFEIPLFTTMAKDMLERANEIPYLKDVQEEQKDYEYVPEEFYTYLDVGDSIYDLLVFLSVVSLVGNQKINRAYELLKENKIAKTESFDMMFLIGKIFSFFDNQEYKGYFNQAKKIDKERYNNELETFLEEKGQKLLVL